VTLHSASLKAYLIALLDSLRNNYDLMELIDNLSGRNVRVAIGFVNTFVGSGHVNARKIIESHQDGGYTIPIHAFMRALIFGDHEHYDPTTSQVCNVLDISMPDGREHFLLPILLSFIERKADPDEGFVSAKTVFEFAQGLSFLSTQIYFSLGRAVAKGMLETSPKFSPEDRWESFRITSVGAYTIHKLLGSFSYLDAMVIDTPIVDVRFRELIQNAEHIWERTNRIDLFLAYLDQEATKVDWNSAGYDWPGMRRVVDAELPLIKRRALQTKEAHPDRKKYNSR
jgi:hypothetical protein